MDDDVYWNDGSLTLADHTHPVDLIEPEEDVPAYDNKDLAKLGAFNPDLLRVLLRVLLFPDGVRQPVHSCWPRLIALAHALHVSPIGEQSMASLAEQMGCTKALLSHYRVALKDFGGLDHHGGKSSEARERLSQIASVAWARKDRKQRGKNQTMLKRKMKA
jgi:hypothetical protein